MSDDLDKDGHGERTNPDDIGAEGGYGFIRPSAEREDTATTEEIVSDYLWETYGIGLETLDETLTDGAPEAGRTAPHEYWGTLGRAIDTYGEGAQLNMAVEELGELVTELARLQRHRVGEESVVEEIADVQIMLDQLRVMFDEPQVDEAIHEKTERLRDRLDDDWV